MVRPHRRGCVCLTCDRRSLRSTQREDEEKVARTTVSRLTEERISQTGNFRRLGALEQPIGMKWA
jgi:hypothetical protein